MSDRFLFICRGFLSSFPTVNFFQTKKIYLTGTESPGPTACAALFAENMAIFSRTESSSVLSDIVKENLLNLISKCRLYTIDTLQQIVDVNKLNISNSYDPEDGN